MLSVGGRLRQARGLVETLSTRELDRLAGLAVGHTHQIESGAKPRIETRTAESLAKVLGLSLDWLISGDERKAPSSRVVRAAVEAARSKQSAA